MAKVTIILEDNEDGKAHVSLEFYPPISPKAKEVTDAQILGLEALKAIIEHGEETEEISYNA